jgi:hypothetical protein
MLVSCLAFNALHGVREPSYLDVVKGINIIMNITKLRCENVDSIKMARDRAQCRSMKHSGSIKGISYSTDRILAAYEGLCSTESLG